MLKLKTICKPIMGTPVSVFSQSAHDYLAWECSPEVVCDNFGNESVVEMYANCPEYTGDPATITIVIA